MDNENYTIDNEAEFYDIEDSGEDQVSSSDIESLFEEDGYSSMVQGLGQGEILRVNATLSARWSGVRSCSRQSRAGRAILGKLERWAQGQIKEHRGLQLLRYDLDGPARYHWRNRRSRWSGKRSCVGWSTFKVYIEFRKP